MNICDNVEVKRKGPELIRGHLYQRKTGAIYVANQYNCLTNLETGLTFDGNNGFGDFAHEFTDVTEEYCLQRVK